MGWTVSHNPALPKGPGCDLTPIHCGFVMDREILLLFTDSCFSCCYGSVRSDTSIPLTSIVTPRWQVVCRSPEVPFRRRYRRPRPKVSSTTTHDLMSTGVDHWRLPNRSTIVPVRMATSRLTRQFHNHHVSISEAHGARQGLYEGHEVDVGGAGT